METNKEAAKENPPTKSGSIIQISSLYIQLPFAPTEMNGSDCSDHNFSIRGYTLARRETDQKFSILFPSIGNSSDQELPPMESPYFRYWRCAECRSKEMQTAGIQQGSNIATGDATGSIGTNIGMQQGLTPETTQSSGTNTVIQQSRVVGMVEDIRSTGKTVEIQQGLTAQATEGIQSICTTVGIQKGPMAQTTEGIGSIGTDVNANENTVECNKSLQNPQKITTTKAADATFTGDKSQPIEPIKDAVEKVSDEAEKVKNGGVISGGNTEIPAEKMNTESGNINTRSELHKTASRNQLIISSEKDRAPSVENTTNGLPGKIDGTESDRCRENDNSNGVQRRKIRKVRLLTDLLGEKDNSRVNTTERNPSVSSALLESAGSGNTILEGQVGPGKDLSNGVQSPRRKVKVNREAEERNDPSNQATDVMAKRKDTGKAIMVIDVPDSVVDKNPSRGEGLFIGTKTERLRRRSDVPPSVSRKKNKQTEVIDFSSSIPPSLRSPPTSSAAGSWGSYPSSEQTAQNYAGLLSGAFKYQPSYNKSAKVGLDLALNISGKRNYCQGSSSKTFLKKDGIHFGGSNPRPAAELERSCSRGPSWDTNERAALISYNLEKNKFPARKEMDFLQLGLKEKTSDQGNPKETDQRADDIPMDIVELLAKKQYEKRNSNTGDFPLVQKTSDTRFFDGEMIMKHLARGYHGFPGYLPVDSQHGATVESENARTNKGNSFTFSQMSKNHLKLAPTEENRKSIFDSFPHSQQKQTSGMQISPADTMRAGLPFMEGVQPLLSSASAKLTYGFGIQQKQVAPQHQGKTISDIKGDELKKTEEARSIFTKQGGAASGSKAKAPLDAYANENIPALQLLSLMDGKSSGTAFGLGTTKIVDKPFAPCSYHPRFSRDERQDFLNGSLLLNQSHPKEPSILRPTPLASYQSSRPHSAASSSQLSFTTPEKDMPRDKSEKPGSSIGGDPSASHEKNKLKAMINGSISSSQNNHRAAYSTRIVFEPVNLPAGVKPGRNFSADGVCRTNRNPADFSFAEAGNMYTICGKDLKSRKRKPYTRRNPVDKDDDAKKERVKKAKLGNEGPKDN